MTSVDLDPLVGQKIGHFKRRRIQLLVTRGISVGLLSFVFAFAIVALIDWYWLLSDSVRWTLTLSSYAFVAVSVWFACISRITRNPSDEQAAVLMENTEPELRENLLSAVELATDNPDALHDSPVFRGLLQGKVAQQMAGVQVNRLLPIRLVAKWLVAALIFVGVVAALLIAGDSRLRQLAVRALNPSANIARISRIQVKVLSPSPASLMMAEDETVAVVAEVSGGRVNEVVLETFSPSQGTLRQTMSGRADGEYAANVHLADEKVEYRIFAGDAITQRYTIDTRSRPHVLAFGKTYNFPAYALLDPQTVQDDHGDLIVLEGTKAELKLKVDQPISEAEIRVSPVGSEEVRTIPLSIENGQVMGQVAVDEPAYYKIHLVAEETGFENIFAPKFEIRPQPDLVPKAGFVDQQETTLLLPPNDILSLRGMAEDDLPLVGLEQHVSINGDEWITLGINAQPVDSTDGKKMEADWKWDFLQHNLKPGDEVITKLVAHDRKGNIGESIPLRIVIAEVEFNPDRHLTMLQKVRFYEDLINFSIETEQSKESASKIINLLSDSKRNPGEHQQDQKDLLDILSKHQELAGNLLKKSLELTKAMPAGADAYDLDLTSRVLARLYHEHTNTALARTRLVGVEDGTKSRRSRIDELKYIVNRIADDAKSVAIHYQSFATHDFVAGIAKDFDSMQHQQNQVVDKAMDSWNRLKRQQAVVLGKLEDVSKLINDHASNLPNHVKGQMEELTRWIEQQLDTFNAASESEDQFPQLKSAARNLAKQLSYKQRYDTVDGGLPNRITGARRDFENRSGTLFVPLYESGVLTRELHRVRNSTLENNPNRDLRLESLNVELETRILGSLNQFRTRKEITQARRDPDSQYAADLGLTSRAASHLISLHRKNAPDCKAHEHLLEISPAYRLLEAGHALKRTEFAMNQLLNLERWNSQQHSACVDHPHQWDAITYGFEFASLQLRNAKVDNRIIGRVDQLRWSSESNMVNQKIGQRRWKRDQQVSAANEVSILRARLIELNNELKPKMDEARAIIQKYAPTIAEMAKQAADEVRELEKETAEAADKAENKQDDSQPGLQELEKKQEQVNQKLDELFDALVEDANKQDLLEEDQRERARDADDSIQMVKQPAQEMNKAFDKAQESPEGKQQASELSKTAEQQEKTAQALDKVAEHFEKLDKGEDVQESREELREFEQQTGIENQLDQNFEDANQLAEMAQQNPMDLMQELEKELRQNPAMQKALSEIAKNTLEEAENSLREAAQQEKNVQQQNESSDKELMKKKDELAKDLRELGNEASKLSRELVQRANHAAQQGKTEEATKKLAEAQNQLNKAAQEASKAQPYHVLKDLQQKANETKEAIDKANQALAEAKQETEKGKDEKIHADENARKAQQNNLENQRKQFRNYQKQIARQQTRTKENEKRVADNQIKQIENQIRLTDQRIKRAQDFLKRKPDDLSRKNQIKADETRKKLDQDRLAEAKAQQKKAEADVQKAKENEAQLTKKSDQPLNAQNPATQFADQVTQEAKEAAKKLQAKADQLADKKGLNDQFKPSKNQLANAQKKQQQITDDVKQTAEDLRRAARHEARLNNDQAADELDKVANEVQKTADQEASEAQEQLAKATQEAESNEQSNNQPQPYKKPNSDPKQGDPKQGKAESPKPSKANSNNDSEALKAQKSVEKAEDALRNQADELSKSIDQLQNQASQQTSQQGEPQQGQPQQGQPQQGQPQQGQPQQGQPQQGQPQQGQPQQGQPQQGQPQQGQPQQGQPQQGQPQQGQPQQGEPQQGEPQQGQSQQGQSPAEIERGQQLAQTLDELDRQMSQQGQPQQGQPQQGQPQQGQPQQGQPQQGQPLNSLAQAAQSQQAAMANARSQSNQQSQLAQMNQPSQPSMPTDAPQDAALYGSQKEFVIRSVDRDGKDWGKLRGKSAEGNTSGQREKVSEEYRKKVEAYFKVLAERAKQKR